MHEVIQQSDLEWNWEENREMCPYALEGNGCNKL